MRTTAVAPEALRKLPSAIWMKGPKAAVSVYHGKPIDMVRQMAEEMGLPSVKDAVGTLLTALYRNRGVLIAIPEDAPEEDLSALFVYSLLDTGLSQPVASS
jgi:hypothetical protein